MTSSYYLAVDVGTSRTAAATARLAPDGSLLAAPFALGRNSDSASSAIFVAEDQLLFGDAAERRGLTQPERLVREFKRRVGDEVPIVAGDQRFAPEELFAGVVGWVVGAVSEREGREPAAIIVTVPVTWGEYRADLVESALARAGWSEVQFTSEPEAAARHYEFVNPLPRGGALGVYDLGGGTFDAVLLRKDENEDVRILGGAVGLADFGGATFDDAVLRHVVAAAGFSAESLASDTSARVGLAALRRECIDGKESLSFDSETIIPVLLSGGSTTVRLTRSEFEGMIEAGVERSIDVLNAALETSGIDAESLDAILLTGGSSRIPRVAQLLSERFDRPIAVDADPKMIIALGALRVLSDRANAAAEAFTAAEYAAMPSGSGDPDRDAATPVMDRDRGKGRRRWRLPAFAYLSAGSLAVAFGLVVTSATALGNAGDLENTGSRSLFGVAFSTSASTDAAEAAELSEAVVPARQQAVEGGSQASAVTESPGGRTGPSAAKTQRTNPPASTAWAQRPTPYVAAKVSAPAGADTGAPATPVGSGDTTMMMEPPVGPSTTNPAPSEPPASDPATTDPVSSDPTSSGTTPSDEPASDPATPEEPASTEMDATP